MNMKDQDVYRETVAQIREAFPGKEVLDVNDVAKFAGYKDARTVRKHFTFTHGRITIAKLALQLT